jgi:hypothetical protein
MVPVLDFAVTTTDLLRRMYLSKSISSCGDNTVEFDTGEGCVATAWMCCGCVMVSSDAVWWW